MSTLEAIKSAVEDLSPADQQELREWLEQSVRDDPSRLQAARRLKRAMDNLGSAILPGVDPQELDSVIDEAAQAARRQK